MWQCEFGGHPDIFFADGIGSAPGGVCHRGASHDQIGTHSVDVEGRAQRRDPVQFAVGQLDVVHPPAGGDYLLREVTVLRGVPGGESGRVSLVVEATANDRAAHRNLTGSVHVDGKPEPVEQLRTQFALFGVHGANQDEPRLM